MRSSQRTDFDEINKVLKNVRRDIDKLKRNLRSQPFCENFGQREIEKLNEKYSQYFYKWGFEPVVGEIERFEEWCENYTPYKGGK